MPLFRVVLNDGSEHLVRSFDTDLGRVTLQEAAKLNTLDLVQYGKIVVSSQALEKIIARANGGQS